MKTLFAYGTLMCAAIMTEVSGLAPAQVAGRLRGYSRRAVRGEWYPGLVPAQGGLVEGVVYLGIPGPVWKRLDRFEGAGYKHRVLQLEIAGRRCSVFTYVARPQHCEPRLKPFRWYRELVYLGARYHGFPADYLQDLAAVEAIEDRDRDRLSRHQALLAMLEADASRP